MKHKNVIEFRCNKCGEKQLRNEAQSNENWNAYDQNQTCECGGKFVMWYNGAPLNEVQE